MSKVLENLLYTKTHEWVKVENGVATIGITDYAQHSLGNIVYLEVNDIDDEVKQFGEFGVVESVKAASDILSPVSGKIIAINDVAVDSPELLNQDPYANWLVKVELANEKELENLLTPALYQLECK